MTHPQSPASPLPEAAEPVAIPKTSALGFLPCPFCGASARFSFGNDGEVVNVRCVRWGDGCMGAGSNEYSRDKARDSWNRRAAPSPVAQAPAQAGEVANDFAAGWNINLCDTRPSEVASPTLADHSIVRAVLATQPLAAPVQQEAEAVRDIGGLMANTMFILAQHPGRVLTDAECATFKRMQVRWDAALATPPAQPVLAPVVREPLSNERIDQLFLDAHAPGYGMGWQECGRRFARAVIQATTGEPS